MSPRRLLSSLVFLVATVAAGVAITLTSVIAPSGRLMMPLGRWWSRTVLRGSGVRVSTDGGEHARSGRPTLFMSTHGSMLDVPAIAISMPDSLRFVAKRSLAWLPFFGWAMLASGGCIFIDRGDRKSAVRSLERAAERIRGGCSVLVFPEGTRSRRGELQEFKKGPFHLAQGAGVPIVPIVVEGARELMPGGSAGSRPGEVRVRFGAPLEVAADDTPSSLAARVREAMIALGARPSTSGRAG
jgi:1-acyl-sn-glycerol-3-phosphate acyltransferase